MAQQGMNNLVLCIQATRIMGTNVMEKEREDASPLLRWIERDGQPSTHEYAIDLLYLLCSAAGVSALFCFARLATFMSPFSLKSNYLSTLFISRRRPLFPTYALALPPVVFPRAGALQLIEGT